MLIKKIPKSKHDPSIMWEMCSEVLSEVHCFLIFIYRMFQKFVPIVNCILRKAFNASLGKCKLIQVRNLSK